MDDFQDTKASVLGEYVASKLNMEEEEETSYIAVFSEYKGYMVFVFENGKIAKVDMAAYETKTNRKKLINAYSDKSPLAAAMYLPEDTDIVICASNGRKLLVNTASVLPKTTKSTQGVQAITLKKKSDKVESVHLYREGEFEKPYRYRPKNLPAAGALPSAADIGEQLTF